MVEVESGGTANVTFLSTGIGGLEIADTASDPTAFTGAVSGFGGVGHSNHTQFIDLLFVMSDATASVTYVSAASHTSGALMVSSGGQLVASIDLIGVYSAGNFTVTSGAGGTVEITDPAVVGGGGVDTGSAAMVWLRNSVDLPGVAAGAHDAGRRHAQPRDRRRPAGRRPCRGRRAARQLHGRQLCRCGARPRRHARHGFAAVGAAPTNTSASLTRSGGGEKDKRPRVGARVHPASPDRTVVVVAIESYNHTPSSPLAASSSIAG